MGSSGLELMTGMKSNNNEHALYAPPGGVVVPPSDRLAGKKYGVSWLYQIACGLAVFISLALLLSLFSVASCDLPAVLQVAPKWVAPAVTMPADQKPLPQAKLPKKVTAQEVNWLLSISTLQGQLINDLIEQSITIRNKQQKAYLNHKIARTTEDLRRTLGLLRKYAPQKVAKSYPFNLRSAPMSKHQSVSVRLKRYPQLLDMLLAQANPATFHPELLQLSAALRAEPNDAEHTDKKRH